MWQGSYRFSGHQWGVGQGGMHSQSIRFQRVTRPDAKLLGDETTLRMIYDCGSGIRAHPGPALAPAISRMLRMIPDGARIDVLAISHFDKDHINGLDLLSQELGKKGIQVGHVWAPILTPVEALFALTSSDSPDAGAYTNWVVDPGSMFAERFAGAEVDFVPANEEPLPLTIPGGVNADSDADVQVSSAIDGRGVIASVAQGNEEERLWEIRPWVTASTLAGSQAVRTDVEKAIGKPLDRCTKDDLLKLAADSSLVNQFHRSVQAHHRTLGASARSSSARTGANLSTLCVYSGPVSPYAWARHRRGWRHLSGDPDAVPVAPAWLGTGDAGLLRAAHVDALRSSLGASRFDRVGVASAPHHGSHHDSAAPLWDALPNLRLVTIEASHATGGRGAHHPHTQVVNELTGRGIPIHFAVDRADGSWHDRGIR